MDEGVLFSGPLSFLTRCKIMTGFGSQEGLDQLLRLFNVVPDDNLAHYVLVVKGSLT